MPERIQLRQWTEADLVAFFRIYGDADVTRLLGAPKPGKPLADLNAAREKLKTVCEKYVEDDRYGYWAIEDLDRASAVGTLILKKLPECDDFEIGWHIAQADWGLGYATEAAQLGLKIGFDEWKLDEIFAIAYPENEKSTRIMQKIGMTRLDPTTKFHGVELEFYRIAREEWLERVAGIEPA